MTTTSSGSRVLWAPRSIALLVCYRFRQSNLCLDFQGKPITARLPNTANILTALPTEMERHVRANPKEDVYSFGMMVLKLLNQMRTGDWNSGSDQRYVAELHQSCAATDPTARPTARGVLHSLQRQMGVHCELSQQVAEQTRQRIDIFTSRPGSAPAGTGPISAACSSSSSSSSSSLSASSSLSRGARHAVGGGSRERSRRRETHEDDLGRRVHGGSSRVGSTLDRSGARDAKRPRR
jgi:hypothetical protein